MKPTNTSLTSCLAQKLSHRALKSEPLLKWCIEASISLSLQGKRRITRLDVCLSYRNYRSFQEGSEPSNITTKDPVNKPTQQLKQSLHLKSWRTYQ